MLPAAVTFHDTILAVHIAATMIAFGVTFAYPLLFAYATRHEPRHLPAFWRAVGLIGQRIVGPGLAVVVIAGVYLASSDHQWGKFYVAWGIGAAIVLGAIGGAFFGPIERKLAAAAEADISAAADGPVAIGADYQRLRRRWVIGGVSNSVLVLATVFLMANHVGA